MFGVREQPKRRRNLVVASFFFGSRSPHWCSSRFVGSRNSAVHGGPIAGRGVGRIGLHVQFGTWNRRGERAANCSGPLSKIGGPNVATCRSSRPSFGWLRQRAHPLMGHRPSRRSRRHRSGGHEGQHRTRRMASDATYGCCQSTCFNGACPQGCFLGHRHRSARSHRPI